MMRQNYFTGQTHVWGGGQKYAKYKINNNLEKLQGGKNAIGGTLPSGPP